MARDGRTLAELTPEEKNAISHRSRALHALVEALRTSSESGGAFRLEL